MSDDKNLDRLEAAFREAQGRTAHSSGPDELLDSLSESVLPVRDSALASEDERAPTVSLDAIRTVVSSALAEALAVLSEPMSSPAAADSSASLGVDAIRTAVREELAAGARPVDAPASLDAGAIRDAIRSELGSLVRESSGGSHASFDQAALLAALHDEIAAIPGRPDPDVDSDAMRMAIREELAAFTTTGPNSALDVEAIKAEIREEIATALRTMPVDGNVEGMRDVVREEVASALRMLPVRAPIVAPPLAGDAAGFVAAVVSEFEEAVERMVRSVSNDLRHEMSLIAIEHNQRLDDVSDGVGGLRRTAAELQLLVGGFAESAAPSASSALPEVARSAALASSHQVLAAQVAQLASDLSKVLRDERKYVYELLENTSVSARFDETLFMLERIERNLSRNQLGDGK